MGPLNRIIKEVGVVNNTFGGDGISIEQNEDNALHLTLTLEGPEHTPWHQGKYKVKINCEENYPFKAPGVAFLTKIFHPGVDSEKGEICRKALEDGWVPTKGLKDVVVIIKDLFYSPSAEGAVNTDAATVFNANRNQFDAQAAEMNTTHAM